jgi:hypothetical protein
MISVFFFASLLAFAPQAAPTPAPTATPIDLNLPEIGHVRSVAPSCAVLRDLTIPAFQAARRADGRFVKDVAPKLLQYSKILNDPFSRDSSNGAIREMTIARMSQQSSLMLEDSTAISKALGDPRMKDSHDPDIQEQRRQLEQLYEYQVGRASVAISQGDLADHSNVVASSPSPTPIPGTSEAPYGMPNLSGIDVLDQNIMRRWTIDVNSGVRSSEEQAARAFIPILRSCQ